jgi:hypothetical protein
MTAAGKPVKRIPWSFIRLVGVIIVVLVGGMVGIEPAVRVAGALMILYAAAHVLAQFTGRRGVCEDSTQLPLGAVLGFAVLQVGMGVFLFARPVTVLRLLGVEGM